MDILEKFILHEIKKDQVLNIIKSINSSEDIDPEDPIVQDLFIKINKIPGNKKYFDWIMLMARDKYASYSLDDIIEALSFYVHNKNIFAKLGLTSLNKNITPEDILYKYKQDIEEMAEQEQSRSLDEKINFKDADVIYKSKNWVAIVPKTMESSKLCAYSSSISKGLVKWCTTARSKEENYFYGEHFNSQFFVYLFKIKGNSFKNSFDKIALKVMDGVPFEAYDALDKLHDPSEIAKYIGNDWPTIKISILKYFDKVKESEANEGIENLDRLYDTIKSKQINDQGTLYEYFIKNIIKLRMENTNWTTLIEKKLPEDKYKFLIKTWIELSVNMSDDGHFDSSTFMKKIPNYIKELNFERNVIFDTKDQLPMSNILKINTPSCVFFNQTYYPRKLIIEGNLSIYDSGRFSSGGAIIKGDLSLLFNDIYNMDIAYRDITIHIGGNLKIQIKRKNYNKNQKDFIEDVINNSFNVRGEVILDFY